VEDLINYQISKLTQKELEAFAAQFKQFTGMDFTDRIVLTLQLWAHGAAIDVAARGLTRAQAAAQLFVSKSTIAAWLKPATSKSSNPVPQWARSKCSNCGRSGMS
jgi:hypothetical protein